MDEIIREEASFFSFKAIFKELKRHLIKIVAVVVTFAVLGGVYGLFFADLTYKTEASLMAFDDEVYADENEEIDVIQRIASSARAMITSASGNAVMENVIEKLKELNVEGAKDMSVKGLKNQLTVSTNSMFVLFTLETTNSDAQIILDTIISEFIDVLNEKDSNGKYVMPFFGGKLKIFTTATKVKGDLSENLVSNAVLFAIVGGVLAVAIVVLFALFRKTVLDKETIECEIGLEVLSVVEEITSGKGGR